MCGRDHRCLEVSNKPVVHVTESLRGEVRRIGASANGSWTAVRLRREPEGDLCLAGDAQHDGDVLLLSLEPLPLIATHVLAAELAGVILHYRGSGDDRYGSPGGVVVLQARQGQRRTEWRPPVPKRAEAPWPISSVRAIFRRRPAPGSTTQGATL
jgi:hypothetical protein